VSDIAAPRRFSGLRRLRVRLHRALGRRAVGRQNWRATLLHYGAVSRLMPDEPGPRYRIALAHLGLERPDEAVDQLQTVLRLDPQHSAGRVLLGQTFFQQHRFAEAFETLDGHADAADDPVAVLGIQTSAAANLGRSETAARLARECRNRVAATPKHPRDFDRWARFARMLDDDDDRRAALRAAIEGFPDSREHVESWAEQLRHLGGIDEPLAGRIEPTLGSRFLEEARDFTQVSERLARGEQEQAARLLLGMQRDRRVNGIWSSLMLEANPDHFVDRVRDTHSPRPPSMDRDIGFVCCHFNPVGYAKRREATRRFRARIAASGVRLITVELAFGESPFELEPGPDVIQLRSDHVMWQKERLLNVGIRRLLDEGYAKIGWLDADIAFEEPDWSQRISRTLTDQRVCQGFDLVHTRRREDAAGRYQVASVRLLREGAALESGSGFAWAARREVLERVGLYDAGILGGGDSFIMSASFDPDQSPHYRANLQNLCERLSVPMREHFLAWAATWLDACGGTASAVPQSIQTAYHGRILDREYAARHWILVEHAFDPDEDLALDASGVWRWNSAKPELHAAVARYFERRREDGESA
jgi:tetratricopeptide (TPR) repeat protein